MRDHHSAWRSNPTTKVLDRVTSTEHVLDAERKVAKAPFDMRSGTPAAMAHAYHIGDGEVAVEYTNVLGMQRIQTLPVAPVGSYPKGAEVFVALDADDGRGRTVLHAMRTLDQPVVAPPAGTRERGRRPPSDRPGAMRAPAIPLPEVQAPERLAAPPKISSGAAAREALAKVRDYYGEPAVLTKQLGGSLRQRPEVPVDRVAISIPSDMDFEMPAELTEERRVLYTPVGGGLREVSADTRPIGDVAWGTEVLVAATVGRPPTPLIPVRRLPPTGMSFEAAEERSGAPAPERLPIVARGSSPQAGTASPTSEAGGAPPLSAFARQADGLYHPVRWYDPAARLWVLVYGLSGHASPTNNITFVVALSRDGSPGLTFDEVGGLTAGVHQAEGGDDRGDKDAAILARRIGRELGIESYGQRFRAMDATVSPMHAKLPPEALRALLSAAVRAATARGFALVPPTPAFGATVAAWQLPLQSVVREGVALILEGAL